MKSKWFLSTVAALFLLSFHSQMAVLAAPPVALSLPISAYFPLKDGMVWTYHSNDPAFPTEIWTALSRRKWKALPRANPAYGQQLTTIKMFDLGPTSHPDAYDHLYYGSNENRVFFYGIQSFINYRPVHAMVFKSPTCVLKVPLRIGATWTSLQPGTNNTRRCTLESKTDTIRAPAGTFYGCLRIKIADFSKSGTPAGEGAMWFAPNVGIVKMTYNDFQHDTTSIMTLTNLRCRK